MCEPGEENRERDMRGGDFDSPDDSDEARMLGLASRISGARDRFVVGTLTNVDTDACEQGLRCSDQGRCTQVTGEERKEKWGGDLKVRSLCVPVFFWCTVVHISMPHSQVTPPQNGTKATSTYLFLSLAPPQLLSRLHSRMEEPGNEATLCVAICI